MSTVWPVAVAGLGPGRLAQAQGLPGPFKDAAKLLQALGLKKQLEGLELAMNRAAEAAVPLASRLLGDAVRSMTVRDAKRLLPGGDTSVTAFFADKTRELLAQTFLPIVMGRGDALVGKVFGALRAAAPKNGGNP